MYSTLLEPNLSTYSTVLLILNKRRAIETWSVSFIDFLSLQLKGDDISGMSLALQKSG
jgi:hypothetical protein